MNSKINNKVKIKNPNKSYLKDKDSKNKKKIINMKFLYEIFQFQQLKTTSISNL